MRTVDLIKRGLTNKCWADIAKAYEDLSGNTFEVEEDDVSIPNDLRTQLLEIRNSINELIDSEDREELEDEAPVIVSPVKKKPGRPKGSKATELPPVKYVAKDKLEIKPWNPDEPHHNNFVDDKSIAPDLIKETRQSIKKRGVRQNQRDEIQYVDVVCSGCNKPELVHPDLAPVRLDITSKEMTKYVCNGCLGGRK